MKLMLRCIGVIVSATLVGCAAPGAGGGGGAAAETDASKRKAVKVTQTAQGVMITSDERILFDTGKATVKDEGQTYIDRVAAILKTKSQANVVIEGHTDNVGAADLNARLSESRAQAVKAALVKAGIEARRISALGFGFKKPVADNATPEGRQANRRTDVLLVGEKVENIGGEEQGDRLSEGFANFLKDPAGALKNLLSR